MCKSCSRCDVTYMTIIIQVVLLSPYLCIHSISRVFHSLQSCHIHKGCSESDAAHFFFFDCLFRMYEIHAQYNWILSHVIFPHNLHLHLCPYASVKQGHACLPCSSSFPVHVAMSSRSRHIQTLFHTVHPSVAQKDENLTAPDQDDRGDGGAQSNQIWRLHPGFIDLCEVEHCRAESTCLLDSY